MEQGLPVTTNTPSSKSTTSATSMPTTAIRTTSSSSTTSTTTTTAIGMQRRESRKSFMTVADPGRLGNQGSIQFKFHLTFQFPFQLSFASTGARFNQILKTLLFTFSIEFCSTVRHPVKLKRNINIIYNIFQYSIELSPCGTHSSTSKTQLKSQLKILLKFNWIDTRCASTPPSSPTQWGSTWLPSSLSRRKRCSAPSSGEKLLKLNKWV